MTQTTFASASPDMPHLPADHYAYAPEVHMMGPRADVAAGYLGVSQVVESPVFREINPLTVASELSAKEEPLGQYARAANTMKVSELITASRQTAGKPDITGRVLPQYSSRAAHGHVAATAAARTIAYHLMFPTKTESTAA